MISTLELFNTLPACVVRDICEVDELQVTIENGKIMEVDSNEG